MIENQDQLVLTDPTTQPYQYKIFINNVNDYLGSEVSETLRNDHIIQVNPNIMIGSLNKKDDSVPPPDVQIIDFQNKTQYNSVLFASDIIVFDLNFQNTQEFQYILRVLKYMKLINNKIIICLSTLLSWNQTNSKIIKSSDLQIRVTRFSYLKELENMCLNIHNQNEKVKGYVLNTGIVYGLGEKQLLPYFKQAILQQPQELVVLGQGKNFIPMIHIKDLCQVIQSVAFHKSQKKYYLLSDDSHITQYQLLKTISEGLGNGKVKIKPIDQAVWAIDYDLLTIDFKIEKQNNQIKNWHCRDGFIKNITKIISQFNLYRGIKANKIFIYGMPLSGKSHTSNILAKHYNLPIIRIKQTIQFAKTQPGQFGQQIIRTLDQIKAKMVEQQLKIFQQAKKKKKAKKGEPVQEFNPDKVIPKLPQSFVLRIFQWRLAQSDCQNKGYVLQGWPKTYQQATHIFKQSHFLPNSYIWIQSTEQQIKDRQKKLVAQLIQNSHWTQQGTNRRINTFKKNLEGKHISEFFKESNIDSKKLNYDWNNKHQIINFIQRNGPIGFTPPQPLVIAPSLKVQVVQKQVVEEKILTKEQEKQAFNFELLKNEEKKLLDEKSKPIRQYLIDNVIPHLTQGLIEVCRKIPADPLQYLIEFLQQKTKSA